MLKGMALGVVLALIFAVAVRLEAMWYVVSGLLVILFTCLFGVLIGHYLFEARRKQLQRKGLELLREAGDELPGLSDQLVTLAWTRDRSQLVGVWERLRRIRPAVEELGGLTIAAVFRAMAMSALFAVLGGAISFAVFLTSYMQVERMTQQNALIERQIAQTDQQMRTLDVQISLSIAERRQATLRELIADISADPRHECGADVPLSKLGGKKRCLRDGTLRQISAFFPTLTAYRPLLPAAETAANTLAPDPTSPEQAQFLRLLSTLDIEVGDEALDLAQPATFLDHADLHATELARIRLPGVRMRGVQLYDADLTGADLHGADATLGRLSRARLVQANLADAVLRTANLAGADLTGANLAGADLTAALLKGAVLSQAQLAKAKLHGADLTGVDLVGADLTDADLALADLQTATLPTVPKVRAAAFWWLGLYPPDYAAKLGVDADALARNRAALDRLRKEGADVAAIVQELKTAAPSAPG
jgi:uncharacterized protein YjbI with pentapeptide repeats